MTVLDWQLWNNEAAKTRPTDTTGHVNAKKWLRRKAVDSFGKQLFGVNPDWSVWSVFSVIWKAAEHLYRGRADSSKSTDRMLMLWGSPPSSILSETYKGNAALIMDSHPSSFNLFPPLNTHSATSLPSCLPLSRSHSTPCPTPCPASLMRPV